MTGDELGETAVAPNFSTRWVGRAYHYVEQTGSTNDRLQAMDGTGDGHHLPEGAVVVTNYQSAGRGRMARRWEAPAGTSLLFSTLFRPGWPAEHGMWLMMLGSLATAEAIETVADVPVRFKWPNDLLVEVDGAWRKVGGLLLETRLDAGGNVTTAVLGIGINVNQSADQLPDAIYPPTSLRLASGGPLSRQALLVACLNRLEWHYDAAANGRSPRNGWRKRLITLGQTVTVSTNSSKAPLEGVAEDVDQWGRLLVRDQAGQLQAIAAGDVTLHEAHQK
jgi:BirA family biotin operon repressor/biotin-[acetyl-CoA-carboxylase] ligase